MWRMFVQGWICQTGDNLLVDACRHTKSRLSRERKLGHASPRSKQLLFGNYLGPRPQCTWVASNEWMDGWMHADGGAAAGWAGGVACVLHRGSRVSVCGWSPSCQQHFAWGQHQHMLGICRMMTQEESSRAGVNGTKWMMSLISSRSTSSSL